MDPFKTSVQSSRSLFIHLYPKNTKEKEKEPSTQPQHIPKQLLQQPMHTTPIPTRRKPAHTVRAPSSQNKLGIFFDYAPPTPHTQPTPSSSSASSSSSPHTPKTRSKQPTPSTSSIYALAPSLPLYHPLGKLALSLLPRTHPHTPPTALDALIPQPSPNRSRPRPRRSRKAATGGTKARDKLDEDALALIDVGKRRSHAAAPALTPPVPVSLPAEPGAKRKRREVEDIEEPILLAPPKRSRGVSPLPGPNPEEEMLMDAVVGDSPKPAAVANGRTRKRNSGGGTTGGTRRRRPAAARKDESEELLAVLQVPPGLELDLGLAIPAPRLREIHA